MRMRSYRIMEALSAVDEELLLRCEQEHVHGRRLDGAARGRTAVFGTIWRHSRAWAAVLCLAVVGGISWGGYQLMKEAGNDNSSGGFSMSNEQMCQEMYDAEKVEENISEVAGAYAEEEKQLESSIGNDAMDSNGLENSDISDGVGGIDGVENMNGNDVEGDNPAVGSFESSENIKDREIEKESVGSPTYKQSETKLSTLEEAQVLEGLGCYVPGQLPEGYAFEEATYYPDALKKLVVVWCNGTDSIVVTIEEKEGSLSTADTDTPEAYDKRLYEAPYEEAVPANYWEIFQNPVFAYGDFSLEIVRSCMAPCEDAENTDMSESHFGVLYPDGVLVSFEGCGTAEEIWEIFCSMPIYR